MTEKLLLQSKNTKYFVTIIGGIIVAIIFSNFIAKDLIKNLASYYRIFQERVINIDINQNQLLLSVASYRVKELGLLFIINFFAIGKTYNLLYCTYLGFSNMVIIIGLSYVYQAKSILVYISYITPHYILYALVIAFIFKNSDKMCNDIRFNRYISDGLLMLGKLTLIFILLLIAEILTETYINPIIMLKMLNNL